MSITNLGFIQVQHLHLIGGIQMEIKVSEVMQREDNSLYLKEIEMINYEKGEILNTPDNVVKLMTDVFEINNKIR